MINGAAVFRFLAGYMDADGSFFVSLSGGYYQPAASAVSIDKPVLEAPARTFGGSVRPRPVPKGNHKPAYQWAVMFDRAREVAQALLPYLILKRRQAEIVMNWPAGIKGFAPKPETKVRPRGLYSAQAREERRTEQDSMYAEIRALNGKSG